MAKKGRKAKKTQTKKTTKTKNIKKNFKEIIETAMQEPETYF